MLPLVHLILKTLEDSDNDNAYVFTVTYTNAVGKTFAETVTMNVTNNAIADVAITQTDSELTTTGRSSIQVSAITQQILNLILLMQQPGSVVTRC